MPARPRLRLVPADHDRLYDRYVLAKTKDTELTLRGLLAEFPALSLEPVLPALLDRTLADLTIITVREPEPGAQLYLPPSLTWRDIANATPGADGTDGAGQTGTDDAGQRAEGTQADPPTEVKPHPDRLSERAAVLIAHAREISDAAGLLKEGMSVLIQCEKLLVEHLATRIESLSGRPARKIEVEAAATATANPLGGIGGSSRRGDLISGLEKAVRDAVPGDMVVIPHLDLLGGGTDASLSGEAREIIDLLYEHSDRVLLAFCDPSLTIPEVLANRFAVRLSMDILPREVEASDGSMLPIGVALVTREEADLFEGFDPNDFYKHVAGMNAVRLRHALMYATHRYWSDAGGKRPTFDLLKELLRRFKARNSATFELPDTKLNKIGGHEAVKVELQNVIDILKGDLAAIPKHMRSELIPRGFIFYGEPGTGKTLFAKAIATEIGGTIQVVSGPEITDMYVGESERKLRVLFAEARRNAPAVLVFDEFDSIAAKRSGRDDGGSRAGNAVVAQLLTELDGFRPEVPVLIIGTTNRIDMIDEALLRPSRFRQIKIGLPDRPEERKEIARIHAEHFEVNCSEELLDAIANATNGMNGDEIRSIFRDAKANELVGKKEPATARVLGRIVGRLRLEQQSREAQSRDLARPGIRTAVTFAVRPTQPPVAAAQISVPATDGEEEAT
jgi:transitional endoplasmic reticulum ATPase